MKRYEKHRFSDEIRQQISSLKPDNWHGFVALLQDYAIIAGAIWLSVGVSYWFYPLSVILIGSRQSGLSSLMHEAAHYTMFRSRRLNLVAGMLLTAYPVFHKFFPYIESHVKMHHGMLGDTENDPDLAYFTEQGVYAPENERDYLRRMFLYPLLGSKYISYLKYIFLNRNRNSDEKWNALYEIENLFFLVVWSGIIAILAFSGFLFEFLIFWIVPYVVVFQTISWFVELSEHNPRIGSSNLDIEMTRNRKSRGLEWFLTALHNDDYHLDHHLPRTPFWALPRARTIRLQDPNHARIDRTMGGLFFRGRDGEPSLFEELRNYARSESRRLTRKPENRAVPIASEAADLS